MSLELSIVMPCLDEAATLATCIAKARRFLDRAGIAGEVVVGDNGSTDGSREIAQREGARLVDVSIRGYGAALYGAIAASRGQYCIMADADDSYDFERLELFVQSLRAGADLVMGNRFAGGIAEGAMPWKNRYIGNPALSGLGRFLFASPAKDFHCGLRAFSRDAFLRMDLRTTGMEFASEMVIKASLLNMKIVEVPTTLSRDGRSRPPHLRPFRDGWRHLRFMLLFSPNWLFLYPGLLLMTAGAALGGALLAHPVQVMGATLSIDTLIYCASMIEIGFQAVLFALLSRAYAIQEGLFPNPVKPSLFNRAFTLERGIILGAALLLLGFSLLIVAFRSWQNVNFGALDVQRVTPLVVSSSLFLSLGFEVTLSSFLLSMLQLNVRIFPKSDASA
ncbi:MAG TPA: glycosyltransferase family 2 protein [Methylocystis sp.]|nr:glycosyltransferase family 2 protein [Methylocystis sp.]